MDDQLKERIAIKTDVFGCDVIKDSMVLSGLKLEDFHFQVDEDG